MLNNHSYQLNLTVHNVNFVILNHPLDGMKNFKDNNFIHILYIMYRSDIYYILLLVFLVIHTLFLLILLLLLFLHKIPLDNFYILMSQMFLNHSYFTQEDVLYNY